MSVPKFPFIGWDNRFADAIPVASSTATGAASNIADMRPYTSWTPAILPANVTVDCGAAKSADKLCLFNHNLFSNGCTIAVHGSTDNFVTSDVTVDTYAPASDKPFIRDFASATYRYWRIVITGTTAPTLTIVALGVGMEFPTGLPLGSFDPLNRIIYAQSNVSEAGLPLGTAILFEQFAQTLTFECIDPVWIRNIFLPAWKASLNRTPFLFAYDATNFPNEVYLVQADVSTPLAAAPDTPAYSTLSFAVKGVALP